MSRFVWQLAVAASWCLQAIAANGEVTRVPSPEERFDIDTIPGTVLVRDYDCLASIAEQCVNQKALLKGPPSNERVRLKLCKDSKTWNTTGHDCEGLSTEVCRSAILNRYPTACLRLLYTAEGVRREVDAERDAREQDMRHVCTVLSKLVGENNVLLPEVGAICRNPPPPLDTKTP